MKIKGIHSCNPRVPHGFQWEKSSLRRKKYEKIIPAHHVPLNPMAIAHLHIGETEEFVVKEFNTCRVPGSAPRLTSWNTMQNNIKYAPRNSGFILDLFTLRGQMRGTFHFGGM
jgi:hypothetical protein